MILPPDQQERSESETALPLQDLSEGQHALPPLQSRHPECTIPLTPFQRRLFDGMIKRGGSDTIGLICTAVRIVGAFRSDVLRRVLDVLSYRHESLRITIATEHGSPCQRVTAHSGFFSETVDLSRYPSRQVQTLARTQAQEFVDEKMDLSNGPLLRAKLLKLSSHDHVLIIGMDHMISDAVSCKILNREIWALYRQILHGRALSLPPLPIQFPDYAVWLESTSHFWLDHYGSYWKELLTGALPAVLPRRRDVEGHGQSIETLHFTFGKALTTTLASVARQQNIRIQIAVLTIYTAVMAGWLETNDIVIRYFTHGRHADPALKSMVGFLANDLHLRTTVKPGDTFLDLYPRIESGVHLGYEHYDFGRLASLLPYLICDLNFNWISTEGFSTASISTEEHNLPFNLIPFPLKTTWQAVFFPFFYETPAGIGVTIAYRSAMFTRQTIEEFARNLRRSATLMSQQPSAPVSALPSISR